MAVFVDLDDDDAEPQPLSGSSSGRLLWSNRLGTALHRQLTPPPTPPGTARKRTTSQPAQPAEPSGPTRATKAAAEAVDAEGGGLAVAESPEGSTMTDALACYPVAAAVASWLDLNSLDSLSRTCRQIHAVLLQNRRPLLACTLRCTNEGMPVDGQETLRYRARAGNWYYMEDTSRSRYDGKSGQCARDMVSACRRCGTVVCRNCAIKPPAPIVLRDRHRRLCDACVKAPLPLLARPPLPRGTALHSDAMKRAVCSCETQGVWLCQPCGSSIRSADQEYIGTWKWRTKYGDVLGGVGTGIADGVRGVVCGREAICLAAKEREQETDCDAEDARDAQGSSVAQGLLRASVSSSSAGAGSPSSVSTGSLVLLGGPEAAAASASFSASPPLPSSASPWAAPIAPATQAAVTVGSPLYSPEIEATWVRRRTPSPAMGPGYARHEIEGIGGVVKRKRVKMVRIGACVHDWADELARGEVLAGEISGRTRSWCGWCQRAIPSRRDEESNGMQARPESETKR